MEDVKIPPMPDYSFSTKLVSALSSTVLFGGNVSKDEIYLRASKALYEATYGKHYDENIALDEVKKLCYRDCNGEEYQGEHWSLEKIKELTSKYKFGDNVTEWDKYVAFNYIYSKFCCSFNIEQIVAIGYLLFFAGDNADGKIWDYMGANK